jgi:predicted CXXCH cytochrome family protein
MGSGNCGACHNVHGTPHASLLRRNFARIPAGKFDIHNYDFCFACHDSELVSGNGVGATAFRAGTTNLHRIHLQKGERSTGCLACHEAHGGNHKRLIVESSSYEGSDWKTPMNFTLTPDGGSCSPGCHAPATYSRNRPSPSPSPSPAPKPQPERGVP